jgi:hypothetical protein
MKTANKRFNMIRSVSLPIVVIYKASVTAVFASLRDKIMLHYYLSEMLPAHSIAVIIA